MIKTWMNKTRKAAVGLVTVVAVTAMTPVLFAQNNVPAVLNLVPADSEVVVVVPSLSEFNQKLATLNAAMGMAVPWMGDTLGEVKRGAGMVNGINDDGGMAIILNNLVESAEANDDAPPFLVLVPVSDYNAFVGNFNAQPVAGGITPVTMTQGQDAFVRQVEGYALLGANKALVEGYKPGNAGPAMVKKAGKLGSKYVGSSDFMIITDMSVLGPKLQPKLDQAMKEARQAVENDPEANQSGIDTKIVMDAYSNGMDSLLKSTTMLVIGLDISELGLGMTYAAQFKEGSDVANLIKPSNSSAAKLFAGAANKPYMFAVSQNLDSINMNKIITKVVDLMKVGGQDVGGPEIMKLVNAGMPLFEQTKGMTSVYYPGQMNLAGGLFNNSSMIAVDDTAAYVKTFRDYLDTMANTRVPVKLPPDADGNPQPPAQIAFITNYTADTTNIDGVAVDQYELRYDLPPAILAQINPQMMMLTGMQAQRGYVAQVNGKVIITGTADLPTLTDAIKAAKAGNGMNADKGITQVRTQLTSDADFEAYLNIGTIASTALNFAAALGQQIEVQVPVDLAPIGYSMSLDDNGAAARTFVPMNVIKFSKDVYFSIAPMLAGMGGDQGGQQNQNQDPNQGGGGGPPRY